MPPPTDDSVDDVLLMDVTSIVDFLVCSVVVNECLSARGQPLAFLDNRRTAEIQKHKRSYRETQPSDSSSSEDSESDSTLSETETESEVSAVSSSDSSSSDSEPVRNAPNKRKQSNKNTKKEVKDDLGWNILPNIANLSIVVSEQECVNIGKIHSVVDNLVIVSSNPYMPVLNIDSVLFLGGGKSLGEVFDVIGKVSDPLYVVRFASVEDINERNVTVDQPVFYTPSRVELTKFVFVDALRNEKACDAAWDDDEEMPPDEMYFSDDEQERAARQAHRAAARRNRRPANFDNHDDKPKKQRRQRKRQQNQMKHHPQPNPFRGGAQEYNGRPRFEFRGSNPGWNRPRFTNMPPTERYSCNQREVSNAGQGGAMIRPSLILPNNRPLFPPSSFGATPLGGARFPPQSFVPSQISAGVVRPRFPPASFGASPQFPPAGFGPSPRFPPASFRPGSGSGYGPGTN